MLTTLPLAQVLIGFGVLLLIVALIIRWQSRPQGSVVPIPISATQPTCERCQQTAQLHEYRYHDGAGQRDAMLCISCAAVLRATRLEGRM